MKKINAQINNFRLHEHEDVIEINRRVDVADHLPQDIIGKGAEFQEIRKIHNLELSRLWAELNRVMRNLYIHTADDLGLEAYGEVIGEDLKGDLEERRRQVYALWNLVRSWTHRTLEAWLDETVGPDGYQIDIEYKDYEIYFNIWVGAVHDINALFRKLRLIVPANMVISFRLLMAEGLILKDQTRSFVNPFYPVSTYHQCGTIYRHQYTGKKISTAIRIPNGTAVRPQRQLYTGEAKAGGGRR